MVFHQNHSLEYLTETHGNEPYKPVRRPNHILALISNLEGRAGSRAMLLQLLLRLGDVYRLVFVLGGVLRVRLLRW